MCTLPPKYKPRSRVYLWAIARYDTEKTPFDYGHPGSNARRIVAEINLDFFDFCADESNPAAKLASSGWKRKQPPDSDTNNDVSHSSRLSSDGIPDTKTRDSMGIPRSMSVTGHRRRSRRMTREKKHRSQRCQTDHYNNSDGGNDGNSSDGDSGNTDNGSSGDRDSTKASLKSLLKQLNLHQKSNELETK